MIRSLLGQIISALVVGGFLVAWWMYSGQDFGVMLQELIDLFMWVGRLFEPLVRGLFGATK